ncbi:hypothetical protein AOLI_G00078000 [Acnodon oligacanthus]
MGSIHFFILKFAPLTSLGGPLLLVSPGLFLHPGIHPLPYPGMDPLLLLSHWPLLSLWDLSTSSLWTPATSPSWDGFTSGPQPQSTSPSWTPSTSPSWDGTTFTPESLPVCHPGLCPLLCPVKGSLLLVSPSLLSHPGIQPLIPRGLLCFVSPLTPSASVHLWWCPPGPPLYNYFMNERKHKLPFSTCCPATGFHNHSKQLTVLSLLLLVWQTDSWWSGHFQIKESAESAVFQDTYDQLLLVG